MARVSTKNEWDKISEDEKEGINLIITGTEFHIKKFGVHEMPENVKNKPYLLTVLLTLDSSLIQLKEPFFFFITALRLPKTQE